MAKINDEVHYLHRDYLGSILAISDSSGAVVEERQFGAWGEVDFFKKNGQEADFSESILPRGFTGHEHFSEIALIHMNGRMYDPQLRRFLSPDNNIIDPFDTRSFDRFAYGFHNPLMNSDPSGEFIVAALIGAAIGILTNGINNTINGRGFFEGAFRAAIVGAISGAISFGIGEAAAGIKASLISSGVSKASSALITGAFQAVAHGTLGGINSIFNGGGFGSGFAAGAVGSIAGGLGNKVFRGGFAGTTLSGGLGGGLASLAAGGKFWDGFRNGAISAGLNHGLHELTEPPSLVQRLQRKLQRLHRKFQRSLNKISESFSGFSVEVEFASPFHMLGGQGGYTGVGFEFGVLTRNGQINFFSTTKWSEQGGVAFGVDAGLLFASSTRGAELSNATFVGPGHEFGFNAFLGFSVGGNPSFVHPYSASDFTLIRPSIGFGIDFGITDWKTRTSIYD